MAYGTIGTFEPRSLLADPNGAEMMAINCTPGQGLLKLGTVMVRQDNGMYNAAAEAECTDEKYLCVLDEDVDTDADSVVAQMANAYRAGRLLTKSVTLKDGAALTKACELVLRKQGIVLKQDTRADETVNSVEA